MDSTREHLTIQQSTGNERTERGEELVLAAKAGCHAAFAKLEKTYSNRLFKRIVAITRNREDAEDALQDTFLRAYLALPSFQGRCKFSTWLTRIAINSALMTIRKDRSQPKTSVDLAQDLEDDLPAFEFCDKAPNPEQLLNQKQQLRAIFSAVDQLDSKFRSPIHCLIEEKHSMEELAHRLRISVASVKARLHQARKRLRHRIVSQLQIRVDSLSLSGRSVRSLGSTGMSSPGDRV